MAISWYDTDNPTTLALNYQQAASSWEKNLDMALISAAIFVKFLLRAANYGMLLR
jgi:hypothetical protein